MKLKARPSVLIFILGFRKRKFPHKDFSYRIVSYRKFQSYRVFNDFKISEIDNMKWFM